MVSWPPTTSFPSGSSSSTSECSDPRKLDRIRLPPCDRATRKLREAHRGGLAGLVVGPESRTALFGLGLLGDTVGKVEKVSVFAGTPKLPGPALLQTTGDQLSTNSKSGFSAIVEIPLETTTLKALKAGAFAVVETSAGRLAGQLDLLALEDAIAIAPWCRPTVPTRVAAGHQGPEADACGRTVAMAQAFDAASGDLCSGAECQGDCRLPNTTCQPQIPLLPDPGDFTCRQIRLEECEGGSGWRCNWQNPQWFDCDCACR